MIYQKVAFISKLSVQKKKENDVILWNSCNSTICLVHMKVGDVGLVVSFKFIGIPEAYLETCQTSVMKFFQKQSTAKSCYLLSPKSVVIDVQQDLKYAVPSANVFQISVLGNLFIKNIKKRLQHECFPENIAKFLKTAFLIFDAYLMI